MRNIKNYAEKGMIIRQGREGLSNEELITLVSRMESGSIDELITLAGEIFDFGVYVGARLAVDEALGADCNHLAGTTGGKAPVISSKKLLSMSKALGVKLDDLAFEEN